MKEEKTNLYLLGIVAIVAVVGIVVLILNGRSASVASIYTTEDISGEAVRGKPDLYVGNSDMYILDQPVDDDVLYITFDVNNEGKGATVPKGAVISNTVLISYKLPDGTTVSDIDYPDTLGVLVGESSKGEASFEIDPHIVEALKEGDSFTVRYTIVVDSDNKFAEFDEKDNKQGTSTRSLYIADVSS